MRSQTISSLPGLPYNQAADCLPGFGVCFSEYLAVFHKVEERALQGLRKMVREFLVPWCLLKSCLVLLGSGPGHVKVSCLYSMTIKDLVYATIVNIKA